jgi:hypothetical protein
MSLKRASVSSVDDAGFWPAIRRPSKTEKAAGVFASAGAAGSKAGASEPSEDARTTGGYQNGIAVFTIAAADQQFSYDAREQLRVCSELVTDTQRRFPGVYAVGARTE